MKTIYSIVVLATAGLWSFGLAADTRDVSNTTYMVTYRDGEQITTPNGNEITVGGQSHGSVQDEVTGESMSQWCTGESWQVEGGLMAAGYCTLVADDGDALWVSYVLHGAETAKRGPRSLPAS